MGRQRKRGAAPTCARVGRAGNADEIFAERVIRLEVGVVYGPVAAHAMLATQLHGVRVHPVRFADEMQGAAAHALDMLVARPHRLPGLPAHERPDHAVPGTQVRIGRIKAVELGDADFALAAGRLRKSMPLPVGLAQRIIAHRFKTRAGFQEKNSQALLAQAPRGSRTARAGADHHGIKALVYCHGGK